MKFKSWSSGLWYHGIVPSLHCITTQKATTWMKFTQDEVCIGVFTNLLYLINLNNGYFRVRNLFVDAPVFWKQVMISHLRGHMFSKIKIFIRKFWRAHTWTFLSMRREYAAVYALNVIPASSLRLCGNRDDNFVRIIPTSVIEI